MIPLDWKTKYPDESERRSAANAELARLKAEAKAKGLIAHQIGEYVKHHWRKLCGVPKVELPPEPVPFQGMLVTPFVPPEEVASPPVEKLETSPTIRDVGASSVKGPTVGGGVWKQEPKMEVRNPNVVPEPPEPPRMPTRTPP